jgi:effector-binding domain-containing protein
MKKFLRFIGVLLLIIIAGVVIMGLIAPKDIAAERSVVINAPKERVMAHMFKYENFNTWNPFRDMDTTMVSSVTGTDGAPGAKYEWKGNDDMGSGEMVTKEVTGNEMKYDMRFIEPFESEAKGYWIVEDAGNGTSKAIWGFTTHANFPMNGMMMIMGMRKSLEENFEKGLGRLKTYVEAHPIDAAGANLDIEAIDFPGHMYASVKRTMSINDMEGMISFFDSSFAALAKAAGNRITGPASGLFVTWDEKRGSSDLAAAFPVSGREFVAGASMDAVSPSKGYQIKYIGGYHGLGKAHERLLKHVDEQGKKKHLAIEEYLTGPGDEKDSTKWVTNVIYLIK